MIKISVLTTVYNELFQQIRRCIISTKNQSSVEINVEHIIVIDNPTYPYIEKLNDLIKEVNNDFFQVILMINSENIGIANSLNKAIINSSSNLLAKLDADDWMNEGRLYKQSKLFKDSNLDVSYTDTILFDEKNKKIRCETSFDEKMLYKLLPIKNIISHSSVMFRKQSLLDIGMYRNLQPAEDYDLFLRLLKSGKKFIYLPEALTSREIRGNSISHSDLYYQMNMAKFVKKVNNSSKLSLADKPLKENTARSKRINRRINQFRRSNGFRKLGVGLLSLYIIEDNIESLYFKFLTEVLK